MIRFRNDLSKLPSEEYDFSICRNIISLRNALLQQKEAWTAPAGFRNLFTNGHRLLTGEQFRNDWRTGNCRAELHRLQHETDRAWDTEILPAQRLLQYFSVAYFVPMDIYILNIT